MSREGSSERQALSIFSGAARKLGSIEARVKSELLEGGSRYVALALAMSL